jgi:hypothetical protein
VIPWNNEFHFAFDSTMVTEFFHPSDPLIKSISEATFVVEKKVTEKTSLFVEYVGDYPDQSGPSHQFNSGIVYHLTRTEQLDMHLAFGLNPAYNGRAASASVVLYLHMGHAAEAVRNYCGARFLKTILPWSRNFCARLPVSTSVV